MVMRSCSMALQLLSVCIGSYLSGALVYAVGRWCVACPGFVIDGLLLLCDITCRSLASGATHAGVFGLWIRQTLLIAALVGSCACRLVCRPQHAGSRPRCPAFVTDALSCALRQVCWRGRRKAGVASQRPEQGPRGPLLPHPRRCVQIPI